MGFFFSWAYSQSDPIVSKSTGPLFVRGEQIWILDQTNREYSRIQFFTTPPRIWNGEVESKVFTIGRPYFESEDVTLFFEGGYEELGIDSIKIQFFKGSDNTRKSFFSYIPMSSTEDSIWKRSSPEFWSQDSGIALVGMGYAGTLLFPVDSLNGETVNSVNIRPIYKDGTQGSVSCENTQECDFSSVIGNVDTLFHVSVGGVVGHNGGDSTWVLLGADEGVNLGLRRGTLEEGVYRPVSSQGLDTADVKSVYVNPVNQLVWVFTEENYYVSLDTGKTFTKPRGLSESFEEFITASFDGSQVISVAGIGDTTAISFDRDQQPGIVLFVGDSLLQNGTEENGFFVDGLNVSRDIRIRSLGRVFQGEKSTLVAGTNLNGLSYWDLEENEWAVITRQRTVEGSLKEVITFPTILRQGDVSRLGYSLKEDSRVTIKVFNYAMEEVKTLVRDGFRRGGQARSENPSEDLWNGDNKYGSRVARGVYYISVESDKGEKGWGKVIVVQGREQ